MKVAVFRLTKLALMVGVVGVSVNGHAVYNLYKKEGLTLDINGQIDMQATKQDDEHKILDDVDGVDFGRSTSNGPTREAVETSYIKSSSDKKTRLGQTHGVSYVEFRASQTLPKDWRLTGSIGAGYSNARDLYLNNTSLSFDKKNIGAITLGRQYLHTNYVNRSGTDTPLDIFSTSALRLDYYGVKGLQTSAYYSFSGVADVRKEDNSGIESGFGASASYRFPIADGHGLRVAAGYSQNKANPEFSSLKAGGYELGWIDNTLNRYPAKTQGLAASLEYQAGAFLVAADVGRKKETMSDSLNTPLDEKTSDYLGAKIAYDINPVTQISVGYGTKKTDTTLKSGAKALYSTVNADDLDSNYSYVDGDEIYLFDKADTKEMYVQADYRIRPNVRLYARYDSEKTTYQVGGADISEVKDNNVRAGVVFNF